MPRPKEVAPEDDSLDSRSPATDEEAIAPQQFQAFKKTEYDTLHLSPGKSVLTVLWERVSAEIAQKSSHTMQAGIKGSLTVRKTWSPATTYYDDHPISRQRLPSAEEPSADVVWDRVSAVTDHKSIADMQTEPQAKDTEEGEIEQLLTESDHGTLPSLAAKESAQVVWDRVSSVIGRKSVANTQDNNASYIGSREEQDEVEAEKEGNNLSLDTSNLEHQGQQEADIVTCKKAQVVGTEDKISSKTQDSTSDFAPRGEQEDQQSVEEYVTTYDASNKEQLEEDVPLYEEPKDVTTFGNKEIPCRVTDYLEERVVFTEEAQRSQFSPLVMDSQEMRLPEEEIHEDVKPRHMLHEDVPTSKTVESLSRISDLETKRDDIEEGEEVPYLSYNPPEAVEKQPWQEVAWDKTELRETSRQVTTEELRKELEDLEGSDDEEDSCFYDEESLLLKQPRAMGVGVAGTYVVPDPVRARLDEDVLLYHVPRSPEAQRRLSDKAFFRFK